MTPDESEVSAVVTQFYDAIEHIITGCGVEPMLELWHRAPDVSVAHPLGEWAYGWDEVMATWKVLALVGRPELRGSKIRGLRVHVHGGMAYTTCVYVGSKAYKNVTLNCTNVLQRADGKWKLVHHHADKSPVLESTLAAGAEAAP